MSTVSFSVCGNLDPFYHGGPYAQSHGHQVRHECH